ncbi:MAG TPA: Stp1/IreP family PP2C-type Ser/Thr phosphatase [Oligoflexia bacterium]|nr:Stp1/IreP family PP2C-type Ser/Thr phosphatase [Oligoflexia bacterium]HMP26551.1 Stp1/IreP family PP2C-type Ser/Thr phosphatase [Oligoflexia bacterium]
MKESEIQVTHVGESLKFTFEGASDIGKRREENQDCFGAIQMDGLNLYLVADGMGGVKGGALASKSAIDTILNILSATIHPTPDDVQAAVQAANTKVYELGTSNPEIEGLGTTIVGLLFCKDRNLIFNIGDSRCYTITDKQELKQLTQDHTLVNELIASGSISKEEAEKHPGAHMLTRCLGPSREVEIEMIDMERVKPGDIFLLCTDGLYNMLTELEIVDLISRFSKKEALKAMIDLANARGGVDNITALIVEVERRNQGATSKSKKISENKGFFGHYAEALSPNRTRSYFLRLILSKKYFGLILIAATIAIFLTWIFIKDFSISNIESRLSDSDYQQIKAIQEPPSLTNEDRLQERKLLELEEVAKKASLARWLQEIEGRFAMLDEPLTGKLGEILAEESRKREYLTLELDKLSKQSDTISRELSVWLGRSKRAKNTEITNMAAELAMFSDNIKKRKEIFETASWEYLKLSEELRARSNDPVLAQQVKVAIAKREEASKELTDQIQRLIISSIEKAREVLLEISTRRDQIVAEIEILKDKADFVKFLLGANKQQIQEKKEELKIKREELRKALETTSQEVQS